MALVRKLLRVLRKLFKPRPSRRRKSKRISRRRKISRKIRFRRKKTVLRKRKSSRSVISRRKPRKHRTVAARKAARTQKRLAASGIGKTKPLGSSVRKNAASIPVPEVLAGEITHYFSKIMVCVIKVSAPTLTTGESIHILGATTDFVQVVQSLQVESVDVKSARRGQLVGLKVKKPCRVGDRVFKSSGIRQR